MVPEVFNAVDVVCFVSEQQTVVDTKVFELGDIQHVIRMIAIGVDDIIILKLQRTDTVSVTETTSDINFLPQTTEVTYV